MTVNEMKKNTLYKVTVNNFYINEEGEKVEFTDFVLGYITENKGDENFFFGAVFSYESGYLEGGDTMYLSKAQFAELVTDIKEIEL